MKYKATIFNKHKNTFSIQSTDEYETNERDIDSFTKVYEDAAVRKYITDQVMEKYGFKEVKDLAAENLRTSAKLWADREEFRFLIRHNEDIVGIIGVDVENETTGELWYFKIGSSPSFMLEALQYVLPCLGQEGIDTLLATFKPDNVRSIEILRRLGFENSGKENEMKLGLSSAESTES